MTESLGSYLRQERELRGISLEEVSQKTFIHIDYLRAIESEHFEKLPGLTFAKGFLKSYASYIGLAPEDIMLRFEDLMTVLSGKNKKPPDQVSNKRLITLWIALTLLIVFIFLWLIL